MSEVRRPRFNHVAMSVPAYRERDPRVDIIDKQKEQYPGLSITSFYVGYLLPMMAEVQYFAFDRA